VKAQIHVPSQLGEGILETQLGRRDDVHIEAHVIRRSVGGAMVSIEALAWVARAASRDRTDGETRDQDVAAQEQVALLSLQVERGIGE